MVRPRARAARLLAAAAAPRSEGVNRHKGSMPAAARARDKGNRKRRINAMRSGLVPPSRRRRLGARFIVTAARTKAVDRKTLSRAAGKKGIDSRCVVWWKSFHGARMKVGHRCTFWFKEAEHAEGRVAAIRDVLTSHKMPYVRKEHVRALPARPQYTPGRTPQERAAEARRRCDTPVREGGMFASLAAPQNVEWVRLVVGRMLLDRVLPILSCRKGRVHVRTVVGGKATWAKRTSTGCGLRLTEAMIVLRDRGNGTIVLLYRCCSEDCNVLRGSVWPAGRIGAYVNPAPLRTQRTINIVEWDLTDIKCTRQSIDFADPDANDDDDKEMTTYSVHFIESRDETPIGVKVDGVEVMVVPKSIKILKKQHARCQSRGPESPIGVAGDSAITNVSVVHRLFPCGSVKAVCINHSKTTVEWAAPGVVLAGPQKQRGAAPAGHLGVQEQQKVSKGEMRRFRKALGTVAPEAFFHCMRGTCKGNGHAGVLKEWLRDWGGVRAEDVDDVVHALHWYSVIPWPD
eukprot:gene5744-395_t